MSEFADKLDEFFSENPIEEFQPGAFHNPEADCLEFLISEESHYAERIDNVTTAYIGLESRKLVGACIKGVEELVKEANHNIIVEHGRVRLDLFIASKGSTIEDEHKRMVYKKILQTAQELNIEAELVTA